MPSVVSPARPRRTTELLLLIVAVGIGLGASLLGSIGSEQPITSRQWTQFAVFGTAALVMHIVVRLRARHADPYILPIVVGLNGLGIAIIHRLEDVNTLADSTTQLTWTVLAMAVAAVVLVVVKDHRLLRRWPFLFLIAAGVLLLLPLLPGIGRTVNGARIWVNLGIGTFQPGEIAKILLAVFFAGYLSQNRDIILLAGKRLGPLTFPRVRDLGPLIAAWLVALGVLIFQRDLGSALLFFGLFMVMVYVATSRVSWVLLGLGLIAVGGVLAALFMPHVTARFDVWLNAFDRQIYERQYGGSLQVVEGVFGMASGGLMGTGLGSGSPWRVPLNHSDMIIATIGEELGFVGLAAVLMLYLLLITRIMRAALGTRDHFGKLLASAFAFTFAWQLFVVAGGVMLVIPMTGLTTPFLAAGGSSLLANWIIVALMLRISHSARRPVVVDSLTAANASGPGAGHQDPSVDAGRDDLERAGLGGDRA